MSFGCCKGLTGCANVLTQIYSLFLLGGFMKKLIAMVFFAMFAGNAMAQAGGSAGGAGASGGGAAAGAAAGTIATVAVAVVGLAAAGASNSTAANH
jgi:hypothetical protein